MKTDVIRLVRTRAGLRCEYCKLHQELQGATFHIEHVMPQVQGGTDEEWNLALACPSCNLHKSNRIEIPDPDSTQLVRLFNPRVDRWVDHFFVGWGSRRWPLLCWENDDLRV